jgi:hypothetical protein
MEFRSLIYTAIMKKTKTQDTLSVVHAQVRSMLARSEAFRSLPPDRRKEITRDMTKVANYLAAPRANADADNAVGDVDFPDFVADLLENVFEANLNTALKQTDAYLKLLAEATKSVDEFMKKITDRQAFDHLFDRVPDYSACSESKKKRTRVRLASGRQQVLATMVLMGINRIVVTQGTIEATIKFKKR